MISIVRSTFGLWSECIQPVLSVFKRNGFGKLRVRVSRVSRPGPALSVGLRNSLEERNVLISGRAHVFEA